MRDTQRLPERGRAAPGQHRRQRLVDDSIPLLRRGNARPATNGAPNASNHPDVTTPPTVERRTSSRSDDCQYWTTPFILTKSAKPAAETDGARSSRSSTLSTKGRESR